MSYILFTVNKSLATKPIAILILEERQLGNPSFIERVKPYLDLTVYDKKKPFIKTMHVKYIMLKLIITVQGKHGMILGKWIISKQG